MLRHEVPSLFIYILAFTLIAIHWNDHHHLLRATTRISDAVMWAKVVWMVPDRRFTRGTSRSSPS